MMSVGSMPSMPPGPSPRDQIVSKLDAQVEAGEITAEDEDAMMAALDAIHAERQEAGPPEPGSKPPSKDEMLANMETMLSDQVDAGTLTQDQADELLGMFESGEMGGPPPPPPPPGGQASGVGSQTDQLLSAILEELQSGSGYDETGDSSSSDAEALIVDYTA